MDEEESAGLLSGIQKGLDIKLTIDTNFGEGGGEVMALERSRDMETQTDPTVDDMLEIAGDVGRFLYFAFVVLYLITTPIGFLLNNVPYLIMSPSFLCLS